LLLDGGLQSPPSFFVRRKDPLDHRPMNVHAIVVSVRSAWASVGRWLVAAVTVLAALSAHSAQAEIDQHSFEVAGLRRSFYLYSPVEVAGAARPLLVVLHGSYGKANEMAKLWIDLAQAQGFIVVAPIARQPAAWQIRADGPAFIHALVDEVGRLHPIDRRRLYLFGHSGGAVYALTLAMLESEFFAATAVHAGAWREPKEFIAVPYAKRAIPVAIFVGDRDEYFSLQDVRKTHEALQTAGHPSNLTIISGHTHNYARAADAVNRAAWNWLKVYSSSAPPASAAH
jgi:poly(3-hydroxybutyrate) depolymerase